MAVERAVCLEAKPNAAPQEAHEEVVGKGDPG